jgi:AAA family ATP:ADP antiporter
MDRILDESHLYRDTLSALHTQNQIEDETLSQMEQARQDEIRKARTNLIQLLERRLDNSLERMFRFLGLRYSPEDIYPIYLSLNSKQPDARDNALEFLDNILEPGLKRILIPIVETAMADSISEEVLRKLNIQPPEEFECMKMLLNTHDKRIFLSTIYLIAQLDDPRYIEVLSPLSNVGSDRMRARISTAIETLRTNTSGGPNQG